MILECSVESWEVEMMASSAAIPRWRNCGKRAPISEVDWAVRRGND